METWTAREMVQGRFRLRINFGGKPFWCEFDYVVRPSPEVDGVKVVQASQSVELARWSPFIQRGIEQAVREFFEGGRKLSSILIELNEVYTHPTDTTEEGCAYYGRSFVSWLLREHGVRTS